MTCITDGILRAKLDGELSEEELREVANHLAACGHCRRRAEELACQAEQVRGVLSTLAPLPGEAPTDARIAFARFQAQRSAREAETPSLLSRLFAPRLRPAWGALAVVSVVVASLSFAPARSWAQKILAMLRVQKITVVTVDLPALPGQESNPRFGEALKRLLSDDVVVTMDPGKPRLVADAQQASQLAGFRVRLLGAPADAPVVSVGGESAFHMTVNRDRLQALLEEAGRPDLELPASLDGATFAVHVSPSVFAQYGSCPKFDHRSPPTPEQMASLNNCVIFTQVPSPTVSVPPELNIAQLAETAFQLAGMSAAEAHTLCQTVDWTSTLVIPIPRDAASAETTEVDGVQATLICSPAYGTWRPAGYTLLWVKNGIIYSLAGFGSPDQAAGLANSLN